MGFWGTMGKIFDPKNIGTAAGFALGGPAGAAIGRTAGGIVPGFGGRESTLEGKGDLGRMLKDAATGFAAGTVASKVPGIKNLEGAFFKGGGAAPGAVAGQVAPAGQVGGTNVATYGANVGATPGEHMLTDVAAKAAGTPSMGAQNLMQTATGPGGAFDISGTTAKLGTTAPDLTSQFNMSAMGGTGPTAGMHAAMPRAGMSGLEKAMLLQTGIGAVGQLGMGIYDEIRRDRDRKVASAVFGDEYLRSMGADPAPSWMMIGGEQRPALGHRGGTPTGYQPQSYRAWAG